MKTINRCNECQVEGLNGCDGINPCEGCTPLYACGACGRAVHPTEAECIGEEAFCPECACEARCNEEDRKMMLDTETIARSENAAWHLDRFAIGEMTPAAFERWARLNLL